MQIIHAQTALLPEGWGQDVRLGIAGGRIDWVKMGLAEPGESVTLERLIERFDPERIPRAPVTVPHLA